MGNITYVQGDAQVHPFEPASFDVAISSFGVMFFDDPVVAFANIASAVLPGGRLAMLVWRPFGQNPWMTTCFEALTAGRDVPQPPTGAPGPFALADPGRVLAVLTDAGFTQVDSAEFDETVYLGPDVDAAHEYMVRGVGFTEGMLAGLGPDGREAALARLHAALEAHADPDGVFMQSAAWLVTARR